MRKKNGIEYDRDRSLRFDRWQFDSWTRNRRAYAVGGLSFDDYGRMHSDSHPLKTERFVGGYPLWLNDPNKLRKVLALELAGHVVETLAELQATSHEKWRRYFKGHWFTAECGIRYLAR